MQKSWSFGFLWRMNGQNIKLSKADIPDFYPFVCKSKLNFGIFVKYEYSNHDITESWNLSEAILHAEENVAY